MVEQENKKSNSKKAKTRLEHMLVPLHEKVSDEEKNELFEYHSITIKDLPKIPISDPAIRHLDVKENDIIKITRNSSTAGKSIFYRGVISE